MNDPVRLPDPKPEPWLDDFSQIMTSSDWYGNEDWGVCYGNFWARRPCKFSHRWSLLDSKPLGAGGYSKMVRRCSRCGSQLSTLDTFKPPRRGTF